MKRFKFIGWFIVVSVLVACNHDSDKNEPQKTEPGLLSWEEFNSFISQETDVTLAVVSTGSVTSQEVSGTSTCEVFLREPALSLSSASSGQGMSVTVGDIVLQLDGSMQQHSLRESKDARAVGADHLFGKEVPFKIGSGNSIRKSTSEPVVSDTMYIPMELKLKAPQLKFIIGLEGGDCIAPGQTVSWNADEKNGKGVIILVSFDPENGYRNQPFAEKGYDERIENVIAVPDNGSYTLSSKLFSGIPKGSIVTIELCRGNFKLSSNDEGSETVSFYSYSLVSFDAVFKD